MCMSTVVSLEHMPKIEMFVSLEDAHLQIFQVLLHCFAKQLTPQQQ